MLSRCFVSIIKSGLKKTLILLLVILCCYGFSYAFLDPRSNQAEEYYKQALEAHKSNKYDLAKIDYQKAIIMGLQDIGRKKITFNNLGVIYAKENNLISAEESFMEALRLDPDYRAAKLNLGLVYDLAGDKDRAFAYWLKVLDLDKLKPKDFIRHRKDTKTIFKDCKNQTCRKIALNDGGVNYAQNGQWKEAEELFKAALSIDPNYKIARLNLGLVYDKQKGELNNLNYWMDVFNLSVEVIKPKDFILAK